MLVMPLFLTTGSCGSGGMNANNVNGSWTATLTGNKGSPNFAFSTTLSQNSDNSVSVTNLNFNTATPCFTGGTTASGGFTLSGNFNGVTSGTLELMVQSSSTTKNILTLNGTVSNNTVTGTWTLTGSTSGCTGAGNFTMQR